MNTITNSNYVNYGPVSVSVSLCFIGSRLGLMTPLTAAAYDFGTRYLFSEGCEGRASCNCCEERMSREGGRSSCGCFCKGRSSCGCFCKGRSSCGCFCEKISSREGGRSSCNCCEEISSREGGRSSCGCFCKGRSSCDCFCEERMSREGVGRVATSARKHLLAGKGRQLTNKDIHGTSG